MSFKHMLGAFLGATAFVNSARVHASRTIRGMSHSKYRKWQRKNRKKPMHSRGRG